jgi:glyoxylase-like metal-dependent hydrolase (beta-lactamase superfamily II)
MAVVTRQVGTATVYALADGEGTFLSTRAQAFPTATPAQWERADAFDPGAATASGEWFLRFRAFAIRLEDGRVILVDAGIGPADAPAAAWAPVPGVLPASLAEAGIDPAEIGQVVLTHLHTDHIGWSVSGLFPNASVLLQRNELEWITPRLNGLLPRDQLALLDGDSQLAPSVKVVATPGHTPGHQSVLVGDSLAITGDLLVHALQLVAPEVGYSHEMDVDRARESRIALLSKVDVLATPHLTEPFIGTVPA